MESKRWVSSILLGLSVLGVSSFAEAKEWFVASGGSGNGDTATPFGKIQDGLSAAMPGDTVTVRAGTYAEALKSARDGSAAMPITLRAEAGAQVVVSMAGELLQVDHAYLVVEGLQFDGQYVNADLLDINDGANSLVLRNVEVRRATKDCIDMGAPKDVLIEDSLIHHCLNSAGGQTDAHGVTGGAVRNLQIVGTEIHTISGDAIQFDPGRQLPGWGDILVDGCKLWTGPLAAAENGFAAGAVPGENAIDTKTNAAAPRAKLTIRNTSAWGFRGGFISNMAAFNLKENIDAELDGVTVFDSEIAFRTRGPGSNGGAWVSIKNAVVFDVDKAVRYEDDIDKLVVYNSTFGEKVTTGFQAASSGATQADVRNLLVLGSALPKEAALPSNLTASASAFLDVTKNDYRLASGAAAIDKGETLPSVSHDRAGTARPQGTAYDVGAYEDCAPPNCGNAGGGGVGAGGSGGSSSGGAPGVGGTAGGQAGGAGAGAGAATGGSGNAGAAGNKATDSGDDGGCGCGVPAKGSGSAPLLSLVMLLLGVRRRRRCLDLRKGHR
ncbi:MAG TPA: choice-of-anchor Q domain-containing protein [Polyangiaceae bacterium]|nr:choice-of-anchor Q domain-containing protein [Polyangiaceae bacterium]